MPCFDRWVRGSGKEVVVTATDANADLLFLRRETINRTTGNRTRRTYSQTELGQGVQWTLAADRRYKLAVRAHPFPTTVAVRITIDGTEVFNRNCATGDSLTAANFRITVRREN